MTTIPRPSIERRSVWRLLGRLLAWSAAVALLLATGTAVWFLLDQQRFTQRLEQIRAVGDPTSFADVERTMHAGVDDQATARWKSALDAYRTTWDQLSKGDRERFLALPCLRCGATLPPPGESWNQLARAQSLLTTMSPVLSQCTEAAASPGAALYAYTFQPPQYWFQVVDQQAITGLEDLLEIELVSAVIERKPDVALRALNSF